MLRQRFPLVIGNRILGRAGKTFIEWIAAIAVSIVLAVASGELLLRFMPLKVPPILNG